MECTYTVLERYIMKRLYEVIVGNIGTEHTGANRALAMRHYREYVSQSKSQRGRAGNEDVILMQDGDIYSEYNPPALWNIVWSPEGRTIATVRAASMQAAKKLTPKPYSKFMGEVYVEAVVTA